MGLILASDGDFYTTQYGGTCTGATGCRTVFKITTSGTLTTLHNFNGTDGKQPDAALVQGTDGNFYGTTYYGGSGKDGTVFKITASGTLTTLHSFGGSDGTTSITFNGTAVSSFTVNSSGTAVFTNVPAGATTGTVRVVTPSASLLSNAPFRVLP